MQPKAIHTYESTGPITRARVTVYGRTPIDAVETGRTAVQTFASRLPTGVNCWAASYAGFDEDSAQHTAVFCVAFGSSDSEQVRKQIDELVAAL